MPAACLAAEVRRMRWHVRGRVQGVGFRPFVYRLAARHCISGFVHNESTDVFIEAQGKMPQLADFYADLLRSPPPLARIEELIGTELPARANERGFHIELSATDGPPPVHLTPDAATCPDCVGELRNPADRRAGHALINCTNCGPRYTILRTVPYDRCNTTMAEFAMCPRCAREYHDPADRRFHAQPTCCPSCGPQLELVDTRGRRIDEHPIAGAVARLLRGEIVAIKSLGGFHLAVRADDASAVARLRERKQRDAKPFALLAGSTAEAARLVRLTPTARSVLAGPAGPIVLAAAVPSSPVASNVAPGNHRLGVMVPNTPVHHLLFAGGLDTVALVMTSANASDEPLVTDNREALSRLGSMCDALLWHDRPIERPVDDSVVLAHECDGPPMPLRRARGYVPDVLAIPSRSPAAGLCLGGELKNTIAIVRGDEVTLSQHLGDLKNVQAFESFRRTILDLQSLLRTRAEWIAHDLHPLYLSTQEARRLAAASGLPLIGVQHHHAHAAAVLAEHGRVGPALAWVCDGVGFGEDGTIWGGELLIAELRRFRRIASLEPVTIPGTDVAARDTRRSAVGLLLLALGGSYDEHPIMNELALSAVERRLLHTMLKRGLGCCVTTAAGRVFDGVAALLGLCLKNRFEAEAPIALEAAAYTVAKVSDHSFARSCDDCVPYFKVRAGPVERLSIVPLIRELLHRRLAGWPAAVLAAWFHDQLAWGLATVAEDAARRSGLRTVALSGGVFCNEQLLMRLAGRLERAGLEVLRHEQAPPNDGGLAYGQAAVAAARLQCGDISRSA